MGSPGRSAWTAGQVARHLGIAESTLRSWHRRYGIGPQGSRPGGYRRYSEEDVARLRRMLDLIGLGMLASEAARTVQAGESGPVPAERDVADLIAAARAADAERCRIVLDSVLARRGVVDGWDLVCRPALAAVDADQRFDPDCMDIEHGLSWAILGALHRIPRPPVSPDPVPVLLACVEAEHHTLPLAALAAALACEQDRLDALDTGEQATSVRGVLSLSYRQLSERAARMFRLLGAHPGPDISLAAAASMSGTSRSQARQMLAELTAASLLSEHQPGRYAFHDLLRAYAAEQARACAAEQARTGGSEAGRRAAVARFLDHYLHTAHAATQLMAPVGHPIELAAAHPGVSPEQVADHEEALAWFRAEHQVLLAVISQAAAEGFDAHAWQLPWTLRSYLDGQGHWQDWAAVNEIALAAAARLGDHNGLGWTEHRIAQVCSLSGAVEDGIAHNTRALAHFRLAGNLAGQGSGHIGLSISLGRLGRHRAALGHARQALRLFRLCGDRIGLAYALHLTGLAHARLGDARQGRVRCQEAVDLYRELGDPGGVADAWHSLASVHHQLGDYEEAVACYQQAAAISGELGDRWGQAYCLINLGDTHEAAGRPLTARRAWQQALEIIGDVHHPDADRIRAMLDAEPAAVSGP